jgi:hypothetical protein
MVSNPGFLGTCRRSVRKSCSGYLVALPLLFAASPPATSQDEADWVTGFPRESIQVAAWPDGRKVADKAQFSGQTWRAGAPTLLTRLFASTRSASELRE